MHILNLVKDYYIFLQNEGGEIKYFAINKKDNDNNQVANVWSLQNPTTTEGGKWQEGWVEVHSDGDKMYQASIFDLDVFSVNQYVCALILMHT